MAQEGSIAYHKRSLAGLSNRSVRDLESAITELEQAGKISIADGRIYNPRAAKELGAIHKNRENAGKGGRQTKSERHVSRASHDHLADFSGEKIGREVVENVASATRAYYEERVEDTQKHGENLGNSIKNNAGAEASLTRPQEPPNKPKREEKRRIDSSIDESARDHVDPNDLFRRLLEAAGPNIDQTSTALEIVGPILDLISLGCDLDRHILPTIRRVVPNLQRPLRTWGARWLRDEILQAKSRDAAPTVPSGSAMTDPRMIEGHPQELIFDLTCGFTMPLRNLAGALKMLRDRDFWAAPSPRPGQPGCKIPDEFLPEDLRQADQNMSKNEQFLSGSER